MSNKDRYSPGDRVRVIGLTDVDTKEQETDDQFGLIGRTGTIVEPAMNDYYDCTVQIDSLSDNPDLVKSYGNPPVFAMLYTDIQPEGPSNNPNTPEHTPCNICGPGHMDEFHTTEQHSEDWVNLADARYTGEVIFMPATIMLTAVAATLPEPITNLFNWWPPKAQWVHVDRRIINALSYALEDMDSNHEILKTLDKLLEDHPERQS